MFGQSLGLCERSKKKQPFVVGEWINVVILSKLNENKNEGKSSLQVDEEKRKLQGAGALLTI